MKPIEYSTEQKTIWNWFILGKNHAVIDAVAGSGKTFSLVEGLNRSSSPRQLYCVFGKRNQLEAEKKITNKKVQVSTYHSLGFRAILQNWRGVKANSYTEFGRVKEIEPTAPAQVHFQASKLVAFIKNTFVRIPTMDEIKKVAIVRDIDSNQKDSAAGWTMDKLCEIALKSIQISLQYPRNGQISFDDMVFIPIVNDWIKPQFSFVVSDESQDLSAPQTEMIKRICEPSGRMCLVGDPHQSIFAFRGTVQDSMAEFQKEMKAERFTLSVSYRCPKKVVELAQSIVSHIQHAPDATEGEIIDCNFDTALTTVKPLDVILSRTNHPLVKTCLSLIKKKIPAYVLGKEIAKMLIDLIDNLDATDINNFYTKLESWLAAKQAKATGFNAARAIEIATDTAETIKAIAESCLTIEQVKQKINSLFFDSENVRVPSVICSTAHKFKGLEAKSVYLLMETFSAGRRAMTPEEQQQETNLRYVAYTRSLDKLIRIN